MMASCIETEQPWILASVLVLFLWGIVLRTLFTTKQ